MQFHGLIRFRKCSAADYGDGCGRVSLLGLPKMDDNDARGSRIIE
jgi:hypothetical protein